MPPKPRVYVGFLEQAVLLATSLLTFYADGYSHGGIGIHIWNVTAEMLLSFQKVRILHNNAQPGLYLTRIGK